MTLVRESIDVAVPVRTAYNQWTQFETFPLFMDGIIKVQQLDDRHVRWVADVDGVRTSWDAEIISQEPDRRIGWRSVEGKETSGDITFEPLDDGSTRVVVNIAYEPERLVESVGSAMGLDARRVRGDLARFKDLIEARGTEAGAWRGTIDDHGAGS